MDVYSKIKNRFPKTKLEPAFSFAKHTTIGTGGSAALAVYPAELEEAAALICYLEEEKIPYFLLGTGANVLPPDGSFEGVVVKFSLLNGLRRTGTSVYAGAGVTGGRLCRFAHQHGLGGVEWLTGIPTSVGGGIAMNAGVAEGHFGDVVESVLAVVNGKLTLIRRNECLFGQKDSVFLRGYAVLGCYFGLKYTSNEEIARKRCYFQSKRASLPKGRSMGCTFVNPAEGLSAGALIERCGFKGKRVGGAVVSNEHANFIMNEGATSSEISGLIALVKRGVYEREKILLREEIRRIIPPT